MTKWRAGFATARCGYTVDSRNTKKSMFYQFVCTIATVHFSYSWLVGGWISCNKFVYEDWTRFQVCAV